MIAVIKSVLWVLLAIGMPQISSPRVPPAPYRAYHGGEAGVVWYSMWWWLAEHPSPNSTCNPNYFAERHPKFLSRFAQSAINDLGCDARLSTQT
jgi:hypothetical protein